MNFDAIAGQADRFGNWDVRLKLEIPFYSAILQRHDARRVCDLGCGSGRHTVAFAQMGFDMTGVDPNPDYIASARERANENQVQARFHAGGFDDVDNLAEAPFDALTILGNAVSLSASMPAVAQHVEVFARVLRSEGLLIIQEPNYHQFDDPEKRWKTLSSSTQPPRLVLKHFAPWGEDRYAVEFLTIEYDEHSGWKQDIRRSSVLALTSERLHSLLDPYFAIIEEYGYASGEAYSAESPDCILVAQRR